jgi:hypothetical protein
MKDFTVDFDLLKASLYGTEQEQAKARNALKVLVDQYEEAEQEQMTVHEDL